MNGPEHYRRAEELLEGRRNGTAGIWAAEEAIALAQVHATLALTAAQIDAATGLTERWDKTLNA